MNVGDVCHRLSDGSELEVLEFCPGAALDVRLRSETDVFWARSTDLREGIMQEESDVDFVRRLQLQAHTFKVEVTSYEQALKASQEYNDWCGEDLADESVYLINRKDNGHGQVRRWQLSFYLRKGATVPFKLTPLGTALLNDEFNCRDERCQEGLLYSDRRVVVHWIPIIERLVRAGLRTTLRSYR